MKILQATCSVSDSIASGGVEVVVRNLQDVNTESGKISRILALHPKNDIPSDLDSEQHYLFESKNLIHGKSWSKYSVKAYFSLIPIIRQFNVIHIHLSKDFFTPVVLLISRLLRKVIVVQTHGMIKENGGNLHKVINTALRMLLGTRTRFLYLTEPEKEELLEIGIRGSFYQVNNPVVRDLSQNVDRTELQSILFLSRFHERKRPLEFVHSAKLILTKYPNMKFIMAGTDDGVFQKTRDLISSLNLNSCFELPGSISRNEIPEVFKRSRIFILPSYGEIFPISVLESAIAGVPIILGRDCPLGERIFEVGGLLFADTPEEIFNAVDLILTNRDLEMSLVSKAATWVEENCSPTAVSKVLSVVYENN